MTTQRAYSILVFVLISFSISCSTNSNKTTPGITWSTPSSITYGTALSATQLNATASVAGTFVYTPPAATVLSAGTQSLSVTFTPTDSTNYTTATAGVSLTVNKATPAITWSSPAAITQGTALSATQLNATASVAGTFVYTPPAATVLSAGIQPLSVTFTPTDSTDYTTATFGVSLTVNTVSGIGPAGGTVNGFYGASVTVPAGALSTSVDIAIPRDSTNAPTIPSTGIDTAGAMYALTPHGTAFSSPATVQIPFDSTRIPTDATPVIYKAEQGGSFAPITTTVNGSMLSASVSNFSWVIPGFASTLPRMVYALTNTSGTLKVSSFKITKGTGALAAASSSASVGDGPISVTVHPSRRFAYVINDGSTTVSGVAPSSISVYQLDAVTGAISGPTDTQVIGGHPISAVVHPTGKFVYVVNEARFGSPVGNVSVFSINQATGALTSQGAPTADSGGAPATALAFSPSGEFAYVTYIHAVGTPSGNTFWDTLETYAVSTTSGQLSTNPIGSAPTGDNPWALVVTPGGHYAYVASLSTQGSVSELSSYTINQTTGVASFQTSLSVQSQPSSLAMDSQGRFLYFTKIQPFFNQNLLAYSISPTTGALTFASAVLLGSGSEVGPMSVVAEPQGQFVYAIDSTNGDIAPYSVASNGALTAGTPVTGIFAGGANGGVGDPYFFAASGTSPVWQNGCTVEVDSAFVFDACPTAFLSSGPGSGSSGGTQPPPAATHVLTVYRDPTWGGSILSNPSGINYSDTSNFFEASFPTGSSVTLSETPSPVPSQAYDVRWTGSCSGTGTSTVVNMSQDQHCYLSLTPTSTR